MIILGFLSYHEGYLKIPNRELMKEFEKALKDKSFGYVSEIIENSKTMLKATVNGDTKTVQKILHDIHNSEIPILQYNDENSLSCVLILAYLSARDTYRVEREGFYKGNSSSHSFGRVSDSHKIKDFGSLLKGYSDFTFQPRRKNDAALIVELKKDESTEVAICYDSKTKEHSCRIEEIL